MILSAARRRHGLLLIAAALPLAACTRPAAPPPDPAVRLQSVAAADPAKYPKGSQPWSNPYLILRPNEIALMSSAAPNEEQILKPGEVLNTLSQLPASAWPYGRAVAILVDEKPSAPEPDKVSLRRVRGIVAGDLAGAHVAIHWVPAS